MKISLFPQRIKINIRRLSPSIISILLIVTLLNLFIYPFLFKHASAASMTNRKVTISDSRAGKENVTYNFAFTAQADTAIKVWKIQFCNESIITNPCTVPTGMVTNTGAARASDNVTGANRTDDLAINGTLTTTVTTPDTQSPLAVTMSYTGITNPTGVDTTYFARITTYSDTPGAPENIIDGTNDMAFAILTSTSIAVTATVDTTLSFTVAGIASASGMVNGATINMTTTANSIPFGLVVPDETIVGAHTITVSTNALNGYTTTVKTATTSAYVLAGVVAGNNIDAFTGTDAVPTTWSTPAGATQNDNTGFFGYTTNDETLSTGPGAADRFKPNKWAGPTSTPKEIAYSVGPSTDYFPSITKIGWQIEINHIQPADTYSGGVVLVTTPTY